MIKNIVSLFFLISITACTSTDWRTASREPAGIAPDPVIEHSAVIEFYAADAFSWRGWFAVHSWIAVKEENSAEYTVYEVVGWRLNQGLSPLSEYKTTTPDRYWFGAKPKKILSISGDKATRLIPKIADAVRRYPWAEQYTVFPGPNSNTFPTWIGLQVPELGLSMPFSAIGSSYANYN